MENIRWRHIVITLLVVYLFVHLPMIIETISAILAGTVEAINHVLSGIINPRRYSGRGYQNNVQSLAELCVFGIVVVAVVKIINKK